MIRIRATVVRHTGNVRAPSGLPRMRENGVILDYHSEHAAPAKRATLPKLQREFASLVRNVRKNEHRLYKAKERGDVKAAVKYESIVSRNKALALACLSTIERMGGTVIHPDDDRLAGKNRF